MTGVLAAAVDGATARRSVGVRGDGCKDKLRRAGAVQPMAERVPGRPARPLRPMSIDPLPRFDDGVPPGRLAPGCDGVCRCYP